jgi:hypothetical protein
MVFTFKNIQQLLCVKTETKIYLGKVVHKIKIQTVSGTIPSVKPVRVQNRFKEKKKKERKSMHDNIVKDYMS